MYTGLSSVVMPAGLPSPEEDVELTKKLVANLTDPNETYGGAIPHLVEIDGDIYDQSIE